MRTITIAVTSGHPDLAEIVCDATQSIAAALSYTTREPMRVTAVTDQGVCLATHDTTDQHGPPALRLLATIQALRTDGTEGDDLATWAGGITQAIALGPLLSRLAADQAANDEVDAIEATIELRRTTTTDQSTPAELSAMPTISLAVGTTVSPIENDVIGEVLATTPINVGGAHLETVYVVKWEDGTYTGEFGYAIRPAGAQAHA